MTAVEAALEEIIAACARHGVGTYMILLQDPDSQNELYSVEGSKPWIVGSLTLKLDETVRRYNDSEPLGRQS